LGHVGKINESNVVKSRSFIYDEKLNSENGINEIEEEDDDEEEGSIDDDCDNKVVDGDVEEIKLEIGLLLLLVEFIAVVVVVEGEAVEGDDVDKTDGEEDEDG
jgi:hypothetical protein